MTDAKTIAAAFARPHDYVDFPHGRLAHWAFGEGPDLVFIHGWPLHGATFRRIIPRLVDDYRCHVFDLPGTGHTIWDDGAPFGLWEHAETLRVALEELGIEDYGVIAHDSGGTIGRLLMTITPGRPTALIMGNTEIPGHPLPGVKAARMAVKLPGAVSVTKFATRFQAVRERMFEGCFTDLAELETDFTDFFVEPFSSDDDYVRGQLRLVEHLDWDVVTNELGGIHEQITAPVLLIWGDDDPWFPWRYGREMIDSFGGDDAEVHIIEGGKLFVHEEYADEFADVTADFLHRHLPPPPR